MAININKVMIAGNLTRDPETRFLANDRAVANFSIAMNRSYRTSSGEQREEVVFVDIEAWGRTAELVGQYLTKGRACFVEGRLRLDSWEDRNGNKRNRLKVVAQNVQFLGGRGEGGRGEGGGEGGGGRGDYQDEDYGRDDQGSGAADSGSTSDAGSELPPPIEAEDDPPF